jgi:HPt (histidine-containing phosphotransfer) domain-containing protein
MPVRKKLTNRKARTVNPPITLDDVASLLIQIEPGDMSQFKKLSKDIATMCSNTSLDEDIRSLSAEAKELIDLLINGETDDAEDVLIEASRLLEQAANVREKKALPLKENETLAVDTNRTETGQGNKDSDVLNPKPGASQSAQESPPDTSFTEAMQSAPSQPELRDTNNEPHSASEEATTQTALPADADHDLIAEFIMESREVLESSETALLELENNPDDDESVNTVFRAFHTVKGTSGFLGLEIVSRMAHLAESLLSRIRNKEIRLVGGYADLSLRSLDMLKKVVTSVEDSLRGAPLDYSG